jgi:hypothetical protein
MGRMLLQEEDMAGREIRITFDPDPQKVLHMQVVGDPSRPPPPAPEPPQHQPVHH